MLVLLPLIASVGGIASTSTVDAHEQLERTISEGVRAAIAAGWRLTDIGFEEQTIVFTVAKKGEPTMRHIAKLDGSNTYTVEPGGAPEYATKPSEFMLRALRAKRGGFELAEDCGGYYERPYITERFETSDAARKLVASTLATAVDLESAYVEGSRVVFDIQLDGGKHTQLVARVDDQGRVVEAEHRRFEYGSNDSTYARIGKLKRIAKGAAVHTIDSTDNGIVLVTNKGRFPIDPDGGAFESLYDDEHGDEGGCGC